jgi:hypothetical protein
MASSGFFELVRITKHRSMAFCTACGKRATLVNSKSAELVCSESAPKRLGGIMVKIETQLNTQTNAWQLCA